MASALREIQYKPQRYEANADGFLIHSCDGSNIKPEQVSPGYFQQNYVPVSDRPGYCRAGVQFRARELTEPLTVSMVVSTRGPEDYEYPIGSWEILDDYRIFGSTLRLHPEVFGVYFEVLP